MLNKMSPFFAIIFSFIFLKEKISVFQTLAVAAAFIGSLFIIKPSFTGIDFLPGFIGKYRRKRTVYCFILFSIFVSCNLTLYYFQLSADGDSAVDLSVMRRTFCRRRAVFNNGGLLLCSGKGNIRL